MGLHHAHPADFTTDVFKEAATIEALICIHRTHEKHLIGIHLSACWTSFGQLAQRPSELCFLQEHAEALGLLVQHTVKQLATGREIGARELANMAYGAARGGRAELVGLSFTAPPTAAEQRGVTNTASAFARGLEDKLFPSLARAAERRMSDFNAQGLANTAWAFATLN